MADISDVFAYLAQVATNAVYPNGTSQPSVAGANPAGGNVIVTIIQGWPIDQQLNAALTAGNAMVSVYSMPALDANTTRFPQMAQTPNGIPNAQLTLTQNGNTVTVGGAISPGEASFIDVNYLPYSRIVLANDTLASIASALASMIPNATASGNVVTIGGDVFSIVCNVSVPVTAQAELARQNRQVQIIIWASNDGVRVALAKAIDVALKETPRIVLAVDNTYARLIYRGTTQSDHQIKQGYYRRDLHYDVEYITTEQVPANTIVNFEVELQPSAGPQTNININ